MKKKLVRNLAMTCVVSAITFSAVFAEVSNTASNGNGYEARKAQIQAQRQKLDQREQALEQRHQEKEAYRAKVQAMRQEHAAERQQLMQQRPKYGSAK